MRQSTNRPIVCDARFLFFPYYVLITCKETGQGPVSFVSLDIFWRGLREVVAQEFRHLEHRNCRLAAEDLLQILVSVDVPLVRRVLEIVLLDVDPDILRNF